MILIISLLLMLLLLTIFTVCTIGVVGAVGVVIFGDVIVCAIFIVLLIRYLIKKEKNKV